MRGNYHLLFSGRKKIAGKAATSMWSWRARVEAPPVFRNFSALSAAIIAAGDAFTIDVGNPANRKVNVYE
jgi:hypothetical protein